MTENQEYFGRKFYQDQKTGYWISTDHSSKRPRIRAHQWVWINTHGPVPKGYHIHHKNDDKSDNRIENLELVDAFRYLSLHGKQSQNVKRAIKMANKYSPLIQAWHDSEEGKAWHKANGTLRWLNKKAVLKICEVCSKEFQTKTYFQKFCSNNCKSQWRRLSGLDDIEIACPICLKTFKKNKYSLKKTCSKECCKKLRYR